MTTTYNYNSILLFIIANILYFANPLSFLRKNKLLNNDRNKSLKHNDIVNIISIIERRIQRDEGNRGIADIIPGPGELLRAAEAIIKANCIIIITGFPCLLDHNPPTETDGPLGAAAIAKALILMGKETYILTDECNEDVILACASGIDYSSCSTNDIKKLHLESFPPKHKFDNNDMARLDTLATSADLVIAIERAGPNSNGQYLTMRGRDMTDIIAPLELFLPDPSDAGNTIEMNSVTSQSAGSNNSRSTSSSPDDANVPSSFSNDSGELINTNNNNEWESVSKILDASIVKINNIIGQDNSKKKVASIGIGDGGNEIGMGKVYNDVASSSSIPNGAAIACIVPTDHLVVSSVSNWGGYALVAAVALLHAISNSNTAPEFVCEDILKKFLPSDEEETLKCSRMIEVGARDGVSGRAENSVDGMPLSTSINLLQELRCIISSQSITS